MSQLNTGPTGSRTGGGHIKLPAMLLFALALLMALVVALPAGDTSAVALPFKTAGADGPRDIGWQSVPGPKTDTSEDYLYRVAAVSANDGLPVASHKSRDTYGSQTAAKDTSPGPVATVTPTATAIATNATTTATATPTCQPGFEVVASPNSGSGVSILTAVSVLAANDAWAVGHYTGTGRYQTLTAHWDGAQWSIVPSPNRSTGDNYLNGVSAITAGDVWAVGSGAGYVLTEHWDGTSWAIVEGNGVVPVNGEQGTVESGFSAVSGIASDDVWAVGWVSSSDPWGHSATCELIAHWDGSQWASLLGGSCSGGLTEPYYALSGVSARAADDVWAVGGWSMLGIGDGVLLYHWDGAHLDPVPAPTPSPGNHPKLTAVSALAENDVWAVGSYFDSSFNAHTLIQHWDGSQWTIVPSPIPPQTGSNYLYGIAAVSASDVWAVGVYYTGPAVPHQGQALIEHWDGAQWSLKPSARPNGGAYLLFDVSAATAGSVWAVGHVDYGDVKQTLIERYTPCLVCTAGFRDVNPSDYFYRPVQCLYCSGTISGYSDGTFRPYNSITRGQIAKIVSNAAGFSDTQSTQMFQDIPVGSTFFQYIGRLASRGYMNGYPCGGVGEQCVPPNNLSYFRPNNKATRGQLTKIVSNAAGFDDTIPTSVQTFTDVPPNSTFWLYVERLLLNRPGVMGGYPCGGANEPCDPQERPYFRPGNNVTRGQTSKIVANSFFPGCQSQAGPKR